MCRTVVGSHCVGIKNGDVPVPALKEFVLLHSSLQTGSLPSNYNTAYQRSQQAVSSVTLLRPTPNSNLSLLLPLNNFNTHPFPLPQVTVLHDHFKGNSHDDVLKKASQLVLSL